MRMLAETTGDFMLVDMAAGQTIPAFRPAVVARTAFIDARIALGQIVKVADLPAEATNEEFQAYWKEAGDRDLAISSFLSKFEPAAEEAPADEAPRTQRRRGK